MPASICDPVTSALRLTLTPDESQNSLLESRLYSSTKNVLISKIDFEESGDYQSNVLDGLKSKYVVIRPKKAVHENKVIKRDSVSGIQTTENNKNVEEGLPKPKRVLFPQEKVRLGWQGAWAAGAGMQNVGNTCYLNSTLQALFHVPALANWLVSDGGHTDKCGQQDSCVVCVMRATLMATQKSGGAPIKPWQVYSKLRLICRHLTPGRQEDAHEFLRYLVEAMEKSYLNRFVNSDKLDQYSKETTPLNQILGGYLRSTVRCLSCHHLSTTYQHFQDLLLDIRKHSTLDEALDSFFSRERLEDLGYKCEACNKKVSATKQFFIERAPMVLCIALKRFSLAGGKLSKHVQFRKKISISKYMYNKINQQQLSYKLVSLVTHLGPSQNCGHYTAIGQASNSNYYQFDDSSVRALPLSAVLGTNAYIMFFEKDNTIEQISPSTASTSSAVYGPQSPENLLTAKSESDLRLITSNSKMVDKSVWDERSDAKDESRRPKVSAGLVVATKSTHQAWTVSSENSAPLLSPSLNGVTYKKVKEKEERRDNEQSPNTSVSSMSPLSDRSGVGVVLAPTSLPAPSTSASVLAINTSADTPAASTTTSTAKSSATASTSTSAAKSSATASTSTSAAKNSATVSTSTSAAKNSATASTSTSAAKSNATASTSTSPVKSSATVSMTTAANSATSLNTLRHLQSVSHRGYGAPIATWNGSHSALTRQVFDERRDERKRALEATDDMDRGRNKKMKKFHHYNRFSNNQNGYNPFQEKQNKPHWGGNFKYRNERRPPYQFNKQHSNKYKRFNRYNNNGHHYSRHH